MFTIKKYPNMPQKSIKITCKDCNKTFEQSVPTEIDITEYPELHDELYDPDFFGCKCPKCKKTSKLFSPFMYIDPRRRIGIYVATLNDNMTKLKYQILDTPINPVMSLRKEYYTTRIVSGQREFIEKRDVLELGLDDRATELLKNYVKNNELKDEKYKTAKDVTLSYFIDKKGQHFVNTYVDNQAFEQITMNIDAYEVLRLKLISKYGERHRDANILINNDWAKNNEDITKSLFNN